MSIDLVIFAVLTGVTNMHTMLYHKGSEEKSDMTLSTYGAHVKL